MPSVSPTTTLAVPRLDLGRSVMSLDLLAQQQRYIGLQVFPAFEVAKESGSYGKIPIASLLANMETARAPGASYNRATWKFETDSYLTEEHGAEEPVDDRTATVFRDYFDHELIAASRVQNVVLRKHEVRVAAALDTAGATYTAAAGNAWNTDNGDPFEDVEAAAQAMYDRGLIPNALVLSWKAFRNLRQNPAIIDRIESGGAGESSAQRTITAQKLADLFDLRYVFVGGGQNVTSNEEQTLAMGSIWPNDKAYVVRVCENTSDLVDPCCGRTMHYSADGSRIGTVFETYREEQTRANIVRARMDTDEKVIHTEAIQRITGIAA